MSSPEAEKMVYRNSGLRKRIIFDTDTRFGLPGGEVDGGLALLYLLSQLDQCEAVLSGITISGRADQRPRSAAAVSWLLRLCGREDIPVYGGAAQKEGASWDAARFLAEETARYPGEVTVLSTGPLNTVKRAGEIDASLYSHLQELVCCGGLLHPFQVRGWKADGDFRFAADPAAAQEVLNRVYLPVVITMHLGMQLKMTIDDLIPFHTAHPGLYYLLKEQLLSSSEYSSKVSEEKLAGTAAREPSVYLLGMLPVLYALHPEFFHTVTRRVLADESLLKTGRLRLVPNEHSDGKGRSHEQALPQGKNMLTPSHLIDIDRCWNTMLEGLILGRFVRISVSGEGGDRQ